MKYFVLISLLLILLTQSSNLRLLTGSCTSNNDCSPGIVCNITSGACVECLTDSQCSSNERCIAPLGICGHNCTSHASCGSNEHCYYDSTPYYCVPNQCVHDGDCPSSTCSAQQLCVVSQSVLPTIDGTCTTNANCSSNKQCITSKGICGHSCSAQQPCTAANTHCDLSTTPYSCVPNTCANDSDCPGSACSNARLCVVVYPNEPACK